MTDRQRDLVARLRAALAGDPRIRLALLFGSQARGQARPDSDVDVAIVPVDPGLALRDELDIQVCVERAARRSAHVVRLDVPDVLLRWEVARHGIPLVVHDRRDLVRFVSTAALDHADLAPMLARAGERFRQRLLSSMAPGDTRG